LLLLLDKAQHEPVLVRRLQHVTLGLNSLVHGTKGSHERNTMTVHVTVVRLKQLQAPLQGELNVRRIGIPLGYELQQALQITHAIV